MRARSDSLYARLLREGLLDEFFGFVATSAPGYREMLAWMAEHDIDTSLGALHNLVTYQMGVWRTEQALRASEEAQSELPANADETLRQRIKGLKFDLTMRDLSVQQQLAVWKLDQAERELAEKSRSARDAAVDALLAEADGNAEAKAALSQYLAALDRSRATPQDAAPATKGPTL